MTTTPVLLLTGYLGSGKTTLLNHILANQRGIRFAVIVNDIGEVNIDASLIQKGGIVGQNKNADDLVALQNGCICCTLKVDLMKQLLELVAQNKFDYIVIEASGICEPEPIAQTISSMPDLAKKYRVDGLPRLDSIVTVVDALRLCDEFGCGESLGGEHDEDDIENLIVQQIEFCNIILLNKIDEVTTEEAARIRAVIRAIQPQAQIIECNYCDVPLDKLLNTNLFDFDKVSSSATWVRVLEGIDEHDDHDDDDDHHEHRHDGEHHEHEHHHHDHDEGEVEEYGIQTFVYFRRPPLDINRFDYFINSKFPKNIIRAKGMVYFSHNTDMCYIFEQAGRQKKLTESGMWYATASPQELKQLLAADPNVAKDWDPKYGDRMIKVVIIGRHLDRAAIEAAFDACLKK